MIEVCFVCLGNICRSPTAEGVMIHLVDQHGLADRIGVDSAGTGSYHIGNSADIRALQAARRRGVDLPGRARQFVASDYQRFDYVLAMDSSNYHHLKKLGGEGKLFLLLDFVEGGKPGQSVPDPYYGGEQEQGLLHHIVRQHGLQVKAEGSG
jgi:protein-tyrosine phosphatase